VVLIRGIQRITQMKFGIT